MNARITRVDGEDLICKIDCQLVRCLTPDSAESDRSSAEHYIFVRGYLPRSVVSYKVKIMDGSALSSTMISFFFCSSNLGLSAIFGKIRGGRESRLSTSCVRHPVTHHAVTLQHLSIRLGTIPAFW